MPIRITCRTAAFISFSDLRLTLFIPFISSLFSIHIDLFFSEDFAFSERMLLVE